MRCLIRSNFLVGFPTGGGGERRLLLLSSLSLLLGPSSDDFTQIVGAEFQSEVRFPVVVDVEVGTFAHQTDRKRLAALVAAAQGITVGVEDVELVAHFLLQANFMDIRFVVDPVVALGYEFAAVLSFLENPRGLASVFVGIDNDLGSYVTRFVSVQCFVFEFVVAP